MRTRVLLVAGALLVLPGCGGSPDDLSPADRDRMAEAMGGGVYGQPGDAAVECQAAVRERLRDPGSADFGDVQTSTAGDAWQVRGEVTGTNGFGGPTRHTYSCVVLGDRDGAFTLVSVDVD